MQDAKVVTKREIAQYQNLVGRLLAWGEKMGVSRNGDEEIAPAKRRKRRKKVVADLPQEP